MSTLKNHPGDWLRDDAAAAFNALEDKYGVFTVNSAARSVAEQNEAIARWDRGGTYNRPPYLYEPARPAERSLHVKDGGIAVDIYEVSRFASVAGEFGFTHPYPGTDPVHFEFVGWNGGSVADFSSTVQNEQNWLRVARGENIQADGRKGPLTKAAYERYQAFLRDWGYGYTGAIDGDWGSQTQKAHAGYFDQFNKSLPDLRVGSQGQYVKDVQFRLGVGGFPTKVDGDFGGDTERQVVNFQRSRNLTPDGVVGINTRRALGL